MAHESRPHKVEAAPGGPADDLSPILPTTSHGWDDFARHIDGTFVVVVRLNGGKYRRRAYLTVKSAELAARRAKARGENAVVILAELRPLYRVIGGGADD